MGGSDLGGPGPVNAAEGPFDTQPAVKPPAGTGRWAQVSNGKWYAFHPSVGPGMEFPYEHPFDVNFWSRLPDVNPEAEGTETWTCRHGTAWVGQGKCQHGCPPHPVRFIPPTDEEIEAATEGLTALLASMESK